ncbi:MAG TPA: hypothetical protein VMV31_05360 [Terriglobales bacterium]|nr:hypothetical protein [Terriglobales bacterium]
MPTPTNRELRQQVKDLEAENLALNAKLEEIAAISADDEDEDLDADQGEDDDQD